MRARVLVFNSLLANSRRPLCGCSLKPRLACTLHRRIRAFVAYIRAFVAYILALTRDFDHGYDSVWLLLRRCVRC